MEEIFGSRDKDADDWIRNNIPAFGSAVNAIKTMIPAVAGNGVEITCGSGLFAKALGIPTWIVPNDGDASMARLPFEDLGLDFIFLSCCGGFPFDLSGIFQEVYRTLKTNGVLIVAFIDTKSPEGKRYSRNLPENSKADAEPIMFDLTHAGFRNFEFVQTLFTPPDEIIEVEAAKPGYGEGSFVVVQARKKI